MSPRTMFTFVSMDDSDSDARMSLSSSLQFLNEQMEQADDFDGSFEAEQEALARSVSSHRSQPVDVLKGLDPHIMSSPGVDMSPTDVVLGSGFGRSQTGPGEDMFASEVSENLLLECRRQQMALREAEKATRKKDEEIAALQKVIASAESRVANQSTNEAELRDNIWTLELKLQELESQLSKHSDQASKMTRETTKLESTRNQQLEELDTLHSRQAQLESALSAQTARAASELENLRALVASSEEKIANLEKEKTELQQDLRRRSFHQIPDLQPLGPEGEEPILEPDLTTGSPPISPVKFMPLSSEGEHAALLQARREILALRSQVTRLRAEKREIPEKESAKPSNRKLPKKVKTPRVRPKFNELGQPTVHDSESLEGSSEGGESDDELKPGSFAGAFDEDPDASTFSDSFGPNTSATGNSDNFFRTLVQSEDVDLSISPEEHISEQALADFMASQEQLVGDADLDTISTEQVLALAESRGLHLAQDQSLHGLETICALNGSVPVPKDVLADMEDKLKNPQLDTVKQMAEDLGFEVRRKEDLTNLEAKVANPSRAEISAWARKSDAVVIPITEYNDLLERVETLQKPAKDLASSSVAERRDHFESLIKTNSSPTRLGRVSDTLKNLGYVPVPNDEYKRLVSNQNVFKPSKGELIRGAKAFGLEVVSTEEYHQMIKTRSRRNSSDVEDDIIDDLQVVPSEYLTNLRRLVEDPSKEDIEAMANKLGLSVVSQEEQAAQSKRHSSSLDDLLAEVRSKGFEAVDGAAYEELNRRAREATKEELQSQAKKHGSVFVEHTPESISALASQIGLRTSFKSAQQEFDERVNELAFPTTDEQLLAKARSLGLVDPPTDAEIRARARELGLVERTDLDTLVSLVKEHGFAAVKEPEYVELQRKADVSTPEDLQVLASKLGHRVISLPEHESIVRKANEPTREEIEHHSTTLGLRLAERSPEEEFQQIAAARGVPLTDQEVISKAKSLGLVDNMSDEKLLEKARELGVYKLSDDEVLERAKTLGLVDEPSEQELLSKARNIINSQKIVDMIPNDYSAVPTKELHDLENDPSTLAKSAEKLGLRLSSKSLDEEFNEKAKELGLPLDDEAVKTKARSLGLVEPLTDEQILERANNFRSDKDVIELASKHGFHVLKNDEFREMQRKLNEPSEEDLEAIGRTKNVKFVTSEDYSNWKSPTLDFLREKLSAHGHKSIDSAEHDEIYRRAVTPTLEEIKEHADQQNHVLVNSEEYGNVMKAVNSPTLDALKKYATAKKHVVLSEDDHNELLRTARSPTLDELRNRAEANEHVLLNTGEHQELIKKANEPNLEEIHAHAVSAGHVILPTSDHEEMSRRATKPTLEELKQHAHSTRHVLVPEEEHNELTRKSETPTLEELRKFAEKSQMLAIPIHEHEDLTRRAYRPTIGELQNFANANSYTVVPDSEFAELQRKSTEPTVQEIQEFAKKSRKVLVDTTKYNELERKSTKPSVKELKSYAQVHHKVVVDAKAYEDLKRKTSTPTKEELEKLADKQHLSVLPEEELKTMKRQLSDPRIDEVSTHAEKLNHRVVSNEDFEELERKASAHQYDPSKHDLDKLAQDRGFALVEKDSDLAILRDDAKLGELAEKRGFKYVPSAKYSEMERLLDTPTPDELEARAMKNGFRITKKSIEDEANVRIAELGIPTTDDAVLEKVKELGFVPIDSGDYDILSRKIDHPTSEEVIDAAERIGFSAIPKDELEALKNPDEKSVSRLASTLGLRVSKKSKEEEFEEQILAKGIPVSDSDVKAKAKTLGLTEPPSKEDIISQALTFGLIHPLSDEQLRERGKSIGLAEPLGKEEILSEARKYGLIDPLSDDQIISKARHLGLVDPLSDEDILKKARDLGLVQPLDDDEIIKKAKSLGLDYPPGKDEVISQAKLAGLVDPLTEEDIRNKASGLGLVEPLDDNAIISKAKTLGLAEPLDDKAIISKAKTLGLAEPLPQDKILSIAKDSGLVDPLTKEEILPQARSLGLVDPLQEEHIIAKARNLGLTDPLSDSQILDRARSLGLTRIFKESEVTEKAKELGMVSEPTDAEIKERAKSLGLVSPLSDGEIIRKAESLGLSGPMEKEEVLSRAREYGLVNPPGKEDILKQAKSLGLSPHPSDSEIIAKARTLGLEKLSKEQIITRAKTLGLVFPLTRRDVIEQAREFGMTDPLDDQEILARARKLGWGPVQKQVVNSNLSDDEIKRRALTLGLEPPMSKQQIVQRAKKLGLVSAIDAKSGNSEKGDSANSLSDREVVERARALGLVKPMTREQVIQTAYRLGLSRPLSKQDILAKAKNLGLVEPKPLSSFEIISKAKALGLVDPKDTTLPPPQPVPVATGSPRKVSTTLSDAQVVNRALKLGLVHKPSNTEILNKAQSLGYGPPLTEQEIRQQAKSLGLVEPPSDKLIAAKAKSMGFVQRNGTKLDARPEPHSHSHPHPLPHPHLGLPISFAESPKSDISEISKDSRNHTRDLKPPKEVGLASPINTAGSPEKAGRPTTTLSGKSAPTVRAPSIPQVRKYEIVRNAPKSSVNSRTLPRAISSRTVRSTSEMSPVLKLSKEEETNVRETLSRRPLQASVSSSSVNSIGSSSVGTEIDRQQVMSYVTAVVIGECLYKYTHGFSLSGLTGGRHERFFWVHPYSMTLYWDKDNPAIYSHTNGHGLHMPKSAPIIAVSEVTDNNPLPTGLHYKSIVIKSLYREIKITCPNRARHRVWYQALKYLIAHTEANKD